MLTKSEAKYIQTLSQKKLREAEKLFIIEGPKIVNEAIGAKNVHIQKIYATDAWIRLNQKVLDTQNVQLITPIELKKISQLKTPNQVIALVQKQDFEKFVFREGSWSLVLDGIQDPGNLGTIIRTADWFGITQIICSMDCADAYGSKVVQATMGSIFRIEILYTNIEEWITQHNTLQYYGAALNGKPLQQCSKLKPGMVIIGNESQGIRKNILPFLHEKITIPKIGNAESLNAAVATGIILSHLK